MNELSILKQAVSKLTFLEEDKKKVYIKMIRNIEDKELRKANQTQKESKQLSFY
ncbi:hypothetical protein PV797_06795 [Clostridiaceae bacterium M8S5]|nr:hypothetical protein PV797_06795 [Clostridiaceae bacterium M8S5]